MTTRQLFETIGQHPWVLVAVFVALPVVAWVLGFCHKREAAGETPWKYVYSTLVYLACVPGMFAAVVTAYSLFFTRESLLDVGILTYLLPIASMAATLVIIRRTVSFALLPGFDRLSGLMVMIGVAFALALAVEKTRIFVLFYAPIAALFVFVAFAFTLMKWGAYTLARRSDQPKTPPPAPPGL